MYNIPSGQSQSRRCATLRQGFLVAALLVLTWAWESARAAEPGGSMDATFDISEFLVLGNHVLEPTAIERAVYPFLGPKRTMDTVKLATEALEAAYKSAGFGTVFVDIPEQEVADGVVRLKVTEGKIDRVRVRGERYFSGRRILAALPALDTGATPNLPALQSELAVLNAQSADRAVTPVLKAGAEPGAVSVDLNVKDTLPLHGSVQYDNRHTADTTPNRATVALSYDNLWQRQDSIGFQYQTAPAKPSDAKVFIANYLAHLGANEGQLEFSYIHTNSDVAALGTLGVLGKGSIYGAHWSSTPWLANGTAGTLNVGAEYKDVYNAVLPNTTGSTAAGAVTTQVKYINWSALYALNFGPAGDPQGVTAALNLGNRTLIPGPVEFQKTRNAAQSNYVYVRLGYNGLESLPAGFSLVEHANAQWADGPLVNNEQFTVGGVETVRGYLEAETLGDLGAAGTLEVHTPKLGLAYGFAFIDGGVAKIDDPLANQRPSVTLVGTGFGVRVENPRGFTGSLDYAVPRRPGVRTLKGDSRIDFLMRYGF